MKKLPQILIWTGLAIAFIGIGVIYFAPEITGDSQSRINLVLYPSVFLPFIGLAVALAQLVLLIQKKYRGLLKFLVPELILLAVYVIYMLPGALQGGDIFLSAPKDISTATKQINSCVIMDMASQVSQQDPKIHISYKSGRTVTVDSKLWPEMRDVALKDVNHCGYRAVGNTGGPVEIVTQYPVYP